MAVQKSMDRSDLRWYAVSSYASELNDSGKSRLSGNDIQSLIAYEKTEKQFSQAEQNILRGIYWRMHYHFEEFESDVEFVRQQLTNLVPPDSSSFNSPVSASILDQSHIEEKFDESQCSAMQIKSMLELGRFLYRNGFKLKDRDSALRFVAKLISSDLIRQSTLDSLHADNHAEFNRLLDRCTQSSKLESANSPRELNSRRIIDGISKILSANQIPIPSDIDSFIFKLSTLSEFRSKICSKFNEKARTKIFQLCELLLKLERSDANVTR